MAKKVAKKVAKKKTAKATGEADAHDSKTATASGGAKKPSKRPAAAPPQFFYGFKDAVSGELRIPARFELVKEFVGARALARSAGQWGVIDASGAWILDPAFEFLSKLENDHIVFRVGRLFGVADLSGREIFKAEFDDVVSIGSKVITVRNGDRFRILDFSGRVIKTDLDHAQSWNSGFSVIVEDGLFSLVDENGKALVEPQPGPIYDFSEGLAAFEKDGKAGYYDLRGQIAIPPQFDAAYDFSEGLARVRQGQAYGYVDTGGKVVIPCKWADPTQVARSSDTEEATRFRNGFAKAARREDGVLRAGFLDRNGEWHDGPDAPRSRAIRELQSVRLENPEWIAYQETLELGAVFDAKLEKYRKKLAAAREKDEAAVIKAFRRVLGLTLDPKTAFLRIVVYDMNDYGFVYHPTAGGGEELDLENGFDAPIKAVLRVDEGGVMDEPRSPKGVKTLNDFLGACARENLEWLCDLWIKAGGESFNKPVFFQNEGSEILDARTKKTVNEDQLRSIR